MLKNCLYLEKLGDEMICQFRDSYLEAKSYKSNEIAGFLLDNYDLVIASSSWDERSVSICGSRTKSNRALLMTYHQEDAYGLQIKHNKMLTDYFSSISRVFTPETDIIRENSIAIDQYWLRISSYIALCFKEAGKPLDVLIDLSACPRIYALSTMAFLIKGCIAKHVTVLYGEGEYTQSDDEKEYIFTGGKWKTITVPGLQGKESVGKKTHMLVSVGFEGVKTYKAVSQKDPELVSILFPSPGFLPDYPNTTKEQNIALFDDFKIPHDCIINAAAGDAVEAWKVVSERNLSKEKEQNIAYLCCGTKPHALGLALNAIVTEKPAVYYNVPEEHRFIRTVPSGVFWKYEIVDLSAL